MTRFWNDLTTSSKIVVIIGIVAAVLIVLGIVGALSDPNSGYCYNRMYNQGFRGDDLDTLVKACLKNPGPGAPSP